MYYLMFVVELGKCVGDCFYTNALNVGTIFET